jgi:DnaJ-domain-containing protein 1
VNEIVSIIILELQGLTPSIAFYMALYILTGWFVSKFAKRTFFRLLWVTLGLYIIIASAKTSNEILYDIDTLFGIGFIYPHIRFVFEWINDTYESFKRTTANIYYFFLTIYFKIKKVVLWFYQIYKKIQSFFSKRKYDKTKKDQKQNKKQNNNQNNYYQEQQYSNSYEQDEKSSNRDNNYSKNDEEQNSSYENNNYQDNSNQNPYEAEFEQFFSTDSYIILGVSRSDNKATIKKAYRKLVMKYHPDINSNDETKKYTTICQMLNKAYEDIG